MKTVNDYMLKYYDSDLKIKREILKIK